MSNFEVWVDRIADVPWGLLILVGAVIGMLKDWLTPDELRSLVTAAGLLGIGHGIHTASKHLPNSRSRSTKT